MFGSVAALTVPGKGFPGVEVAKISVGPERAVRWDPNAPKPPEVQTSGYPDADLGKEHIETASS